METMEKIGRSLWAQIGALFSELPPSLMEQAFHQAHAHIESQMMACESVAALWDLPLLLDVRISTEEEGPGIQRLPLDALELSEDAIDALMGPAPGYDPRESGNSAAKRAHAVWEQKKARLVAMSRSALVAQLRNKATGEPVTLAGLVGSLTFGGGDFPGGGSSASGAHGGNDDGGDGMAPKSEKPSRGGMALGS